jgi:hypothetical protein
MATTAMTVVAAWGLFAVMSPTFVFFVNVRVQLNSDH